MEGFGKNITLECLKLHTYRGLNHKTAKYKQVPVKPLFKAPLKAKFE
jgi:hypothetical protein